MIFLFFPQPRISLWAMFEHADELSPMRKAKVKSRKKLGHLMIFGSRKRALHQPEVTTSGLSLETEINLLSFKPLYFQDTSIKFAYPLT